MSDLKKEVMKNVKEIEKTISNQEEAAKVLKNIDKIIDVFSEQLLEVSKRQIALEEKTEEIFEMLSNIEEELVAGMMDGFSTECPYCGEDVADSIPEDGSDFECPNCHNIIELEMMFDTCDCGCDDCDGDCECDDDCDCRGHCDCDDEDK